MRLTRPSAWSIAIVVSAVVLALAIALQLAQRSAGNASSAAATSFVAATAAAKDDRRPHFKADTRRQLGRFHVGRGQSASRLVGISSATTDEGAECLVEDDVDGESSSCLDNGFFALRKAELMVGTNGGPDRFDELYVAGVVAPGVRAARVVKTDGSEVALELNDARAFLYESPEADLAAKVYPTALRLFGPNGKLVGTVDFPPAG